MRRTDARAETHLQHFTDWTAQAGRLLVQWGACPFPPCGLPDMLRARPAVLRACSARPKRRTAHAAAPLALALPPPPSPVKFVAGLLRRGSHAPPALHAASSEPAALTATDGGA